MYFIDSLSVLQQQQSQKSESVQFKQQLISIIKIIEGLNFLNQTTLSRDSQNPKIELVSVFRDLLFSPSIEIRNPLGYTCDLYCWITHNSFNKSQFQLVFKTKIYRNSVELIFDSNYKLLQKFIKRFNAQQNKIKPFVLFDRVMKNISFKSEVIANVREQTLKEIITKIVKGIEEILVKIIVKLIKTKYLSDLQTVQLLVLREQFQQKRTRRKSTTIHKKYVDEKVILYSKIIGGEFKFDIEYIDEVRNRIRQIKNERYQSLTNKELDEFRKQQQIGQQNLQQKLFICKGIKLLSQQMLIRKLEGGGFSQIYLVQCQYKQQITIASQLDKSQYNRVALQAPNQKYKIIQQPLIKKMRLRQHKQVNGKINSIEDSHESFQNQINCLIYIRNYSCRYIASYYLEVKRQKSQYHCLYSQKYDISLQELFHQYQKQDKSINMNIFEKMKIFLNVSEVLYFLYEKKVLHRDLKPSNIMIDKFKQPKVIDWGSSCTSSSAFFTENFKFYNQFVRSTYPYRQQFNYNIKITDQNIRNDFSRNPFWDVYSFGVIIEESIKFLFSEDSGDYFFWILNELRYLSGICRQENPSDRLEPLQILVYFRRLMKMLSRILSNV